MKLLSLLVFVSLFSFSLLQCQELSLVMRSIVGPASSKFYDYYVIPGCSSQQGKLLIGLNNLGTRGSYSYIYAAPYPNPTKQNCTVTTDTGAKIPLPNITINQLQSQTIYVGVRAIEGVPSSDYSISITRVKSDNSQIPQIDKPVERKASKNSYCKACEEKQNVQKDLFLTYEQMIPGTVGIDETICYKLPVCKTALPRSSTIVLESIVTGRLASFGFTQYLWNDSNVDSRHFFENCLDDAMTTPSFMSCSGVGGIRWDYSNIPDYLYLGIEGWGGSYLSTQNDYFVTVAFTYTPIDGQKKRIKWCG